ncbi:hypothetical protein BV25DRAFT_1187309 [Artomyces pyxidatus]|uniref:Uncharacterized protein n=1 Tax=Artomyces pyxidatus TaxID=48021 RepID=A0ACB8SQN1_9AGAM|nr:hypothetical protein BV25DRAFT_1187309 [Artomyces pyxidatus]
MDSSLAVLSESLAALSLTLLSSCRLSTSPVIRSMDPQPLSPENSQSLSTTRHISDVTILHHFKKTTIDFGQRLSMTTIRSGSESQSNATHSILSHKEITMGPVGMHIGPWKLLDCVLRFESFRIYIHVDQRPIGAA